jgi:hypothetical protein
MLRVGIQENLVFQKAAVNEKGTLALSFRPVSLDPDGPKEEESDDDGFNEEGGARTANNSASLLIFAPKVPTFKDKKTGDDLTDAEKVTIVQNDLNVLQDQLFGFLGCYMPIKELKFKPYENTGVDKTNYKTELLDNDTIQKVYNNYAEKFIAWMKPFFNDDKFPIRLKLVRQSKAKHYATLPGGKFLVENPFVEPMEVPADKSRVKFSKWEKDNGLDNGDPVGQAAADDIPDTTPEASDALYGTR